MNATANNASVRSLAHAYVTMLTHREKFPMSMEQQGVLSTLRDTIRDLIDNPEVTAQVVQDSAEQIAFDNRVDLDLGQNLLLIKPVGIRRTHLRQQANEARQLFGMEKV